MRLQEHGDKQMCTDQAGLQLYVGHQGGEIQRPVDIRVYTKFRARGLRVAEAMEWMRPH